MRCESVKGKYNLLRAVFSVDKRVSSCSFGGTWASCIDAAGNRAEHFRTCISGHLKIVPGIIVDHYLYCGFRTTPSGVQALTRVGGRGAQQGLEKPLTFHATRDKLLRHNGGKTLAKQKLGSTAHEELHMKCSILWRYQYFRTTN